MGMQTSVVWLLPLSDKADALFYKGDKVSWCWNQTWLRLVDRTR